MEIGGTTWIVAADGTQARVFEERSRAGDVRELSERAVHALESDTAQAGMALASARSATKSRGDSSSAWRIS
jgi:hypothetical protein